MATKWLPKSVKEFILKKTLKGNYVFCPCCQNNLATFFPYGTIPRSNAYCPICSSLERHRLTWLFLEQENLLQNENSKEGKLKVLHVAPEPALFRRLIELDKKNIIDYTPCDKFEEGYEYPKITKNYDLTELPEKDNSFDVVLCSHVLEHIPDDTKALEEIYRVLKPNGKAILLVPLDQKLEKTYEDWSLTSPEERLKAFGQTDHVRMYGTDFDAKIKNVGFEVEQFSSKNFDSDEQFKYGLLDEDILFCATKI
ncbi:methyltransferase domain-containing protein [Bernardetia sp. OM2101]|uniref:class I SAM-dependent methyltransferase n=1 Tax=Bernardetia sp. OM2101 TaxID=3344876 RepID=UPI0035CF7188